MSKDKHEAKSSGGEGAGESIGATGVAPVAAAVEVGTVADTRRMALDDVAALYRPPVGYSPLSPELVRGLSKVAGTQVAEVELAVRQVVAQAPSLQVRFGELAPDTTALAPLWERYRASAAALQNAEKQAAYFGDICRVAAHDLLQILGQVDDTVRPAAARNITLAEDFSAVLAISDQRGIAISEGRQRTKANSANGGGAASGNGAPADSSTNDSGDTSPAPPTTPRR